MLGIILMATLVGCGGEPLQPGPNERSARALERIADYLEEASKEPAGVLIPNPEPVKRSKID